MWSISTNILTVLANFLGIHNSILSKNIGRNRGNTNITYMENYPDLRVENTQRE